MRNTIGHHLFLLLIATLQFGCTGGFMPMSGLSADNSSSSTNEFFASAQKVMESKCVSCHSAGGSASFAPLDFTNEAGFISSGMVTPGEPGKSKLVFRLKNYPTGAATTRNMPTGTDLTSTEYQAIYTWVSRMGADTGPYLCNANDPTANLVSSHAKRLSGLQYKNTLRDLMKRFFTDAEVAVIVDATLTANPIPAESARYKRTGNDLSPAHIQAYFQVSDSIASKIIASSTYYPKFVNGVIALESGACSAVDPVNLSTDCKKQFARNLGLRVFRRPLIESGVSDDLTPLLNEFTGVSTKEGVSNVVFRLLLAPEFLMKIEANERPLKTDVLRLSSYAIANRLSYMFWNTMPDETLLGLAKSSDLAETSALSTAVDHVFTSNKLSSSVKEFFNDWLKLEALPTFDTSSAASKLFANGIVFDGTTRQDMINEMQELGDYVAQSGGTFQDVFTTDVSFARSAAMMKLYGMTRAAPTSMTPATALKLPVGSRSGLLTRAAMLVSQSGTGSTNPVLRGTRIRHEILCLHTDPPPPDLGDALQPPVNDENMTVRERYALKTSPTSCNACHRMINPLGFALSNFNGFGLYQTTEPAFNVDGTYANKTLPIDAKVDLSEIVGVGAAAMDHAQYSLMISQRPEARRCFSEAFSTFALEREPVEQKDGCRLNRMVKAANGETPLKDFMKSLALDPEFRLRKTSPETAQ